MTVVAVMNTMLAKPRNSAAGNELASDGTQAMHEQADPEQHRALDDVAGGDRRAAGGDERGGE